MLLNGQVHLFSCRENFEDALVSGLIEVQPCRHASARHCLKSLIDDDQFPTGFDNTHGISGSEEVRRDVDLPPIDQEMVVSDQLTGLIPGTGKPHSINSVIESAFKQDEKVRSSNSLLAIGNFEVVFELSLNQTVHSPDLLLLSQLQAIVGKLASRLAMLSRWVIPPFESTLVRVTTVTFEIQLHCLASANPAIETRIPSQV
jgi:hypothetical protein